jgi:4-carboxymuconolactone decarboxylase
MKGGDMAAVSQDAQSTLERISMGDTDLLEASIGLREIDREYSGLEPHAFSLVKIAALVALDAPPASYAWQVGNALAEGVSPEEIIGVLRAIAPQVGGPRLIAAAPEIMLALGLALPETEE